MNAPKLRSRMVLAGETQSSLCRKIGMSPNTFSNKMKTGDFNLNQAKKIIDILGINSPEEQTQIFLDRPSLN